jgi:hypothetical protein
MKNVIFLLFILLLTITFGACPPLEEDDNVYSGELVTFSEPFELDVYKWFEILDNIAKERRYVTLDLSKAIYADGNEAGGLIKVTVEDGSYSEDYMAFDPFPPASSGKKFIVSIILPAEAQMINQALEDKDIIDDDEGLISAKKCSAFRFFTNLRSVKADNVTLIGNFAFADCTLLSEVVFPRVGHKILEDIELQDDTNVMLNGYRTDIGKYAFTGCTDLKEVRFNSAAVIGASAFLDCTSLTNIDFPEVWRIENNAFEGCTSLVNVFFEKTSKIGEEAFKNCTSLKKAEFNVKPNRFTLGAPLSGGAPVYDSVIFYPSVFTGCKVFEVLNVRRAWNVYFSENVLAYTSSAVEIYLFDEPDGPGETFGQPQNAKFLGELTSVTLKKVTIFVPANGEKIQENIADANIARFIRDNYSVDVNVNKRSL